VTLLLLLSLLLPLLRSSGVWISVVFDVSILEHPQPPKPSGGIPVTAGTRTPGNSEVVVSVQVVAGML